MTASNPPRRDPTARSGVGLPDVPKPAPATDRLLELARAVLAETTPARALAAALDGLITLSGAERGLIAVFDSAGRPRFEAARNLAREDLDAPEFQVSRTIMEQVRRSGEAVRQADAQEDPALGKRRSVLRLRLLSVLCLPIHHDGECFGVVYLDHRSARGVFERRAAELTAGFAELISHAAWNALERERLERRVDGLREELDGRAGFGRIVTRDPAMLRSLELAARVARSSATVLITGESGTGKELVARAIHETSGRRGELVAVNCGALPEDLFEAELFGSRRGAYTGAVRDIPGWFERARGGTLFLDEIGEVSPGCQAKLLRALETGEYTPLGETRLRRSDARVIAATNRNLAERVGQGTFREDLYYRLAVVEVALPPLRERAGDLPLLAARLLTEAARAHGRSLRLSKGAEARLLEHSWPGNVRELWNALQRAALTAQGDEITPDELSLPSAAGDAAAPGGLARIGAGGPLGSIGFREAKERAVERFERDYLARCLGATRGNISAAARLAGIDYKNFYTKLKRYGIEARRFKRTD